MNQESSAASWLLMGASSVALAAMVMMLSTRTVQADVRLTRPAQTAATGPLVASPEPAQQGAKPATHFIHWKDRIHGIASWYGGVFNGRKTASGERFDKNALTACHPSLPFGSLVRVVNRNNKRSVVVRITDRGDLVNEGRVIDLSWAAAEQLGMTGAGLAHVDLQVLTLGRRRDNN